MAKNINAIRYLECSAKHNRGVKECFEQSAKVALSGMISSLSATLTKLFINLVKLKTAHDSKSNCIIL
jgi:hypothetical protein